MENAPEECFYGAFLPFAFHAKLVLATLTIGRGFGSLLVAAPSSRGGEGTATRRLWFWLLGFAPVMDFEGFKSAENTPPSQSFSPVLDISSPCRILVRNPSPFS